jgi:hypothetical protein
MRAERKKAEAEAEGAKANAESTELGNVEKAISIWREMALQLKAELEQSRTQYSEVNRHVDDLRREIKGLRETSNKILRLLDRITPENLEKMKEQIKAELNAKDN